MSRYDWESGTIKLSVKEFTKFRQHLVSAYNKALQEDFNELQKLYDKLKAAGKGKRKFNYAAALNEELNKEVRQPYWGTAYAVNLQIIDRDFVAPLLINKEGKLTTLKKGMFKGVTVSAKHDTFPPPDGFVHSDEGTLSLAPQSKCISWTVSENNHACERARESFFGKLLFKYLNTVEWTRNTGGTIVGNDEYNSEDKEAGGAENYIKVAYGPIGKAEQDSLLYTRRIRRR